MNEEKKDYALIVIGSIVRDVSAVKIDCEEEEPKEEEASQE